MKILSIFTILGLLTIMTCADKNNLSQRNIYQTNLDVEHKLFTYLLSDEKYHFLFGAIEKDIQDFRTSEITINRTVVGDKKNWTSFCKNIPGKCQAVCQTEEYLYLISRQQYQERQDPKYSKHKLYRISKEDGMVLELYEWDKGNSFVRDVYFTSKDEGVILFRPSGNPLDYQILRTNNGGKEWSVKSINKPILVTHMFNNKIYFLSYKRNNKNKWIYSIEMKNNKIDSLQFNLNITDFAVGKNGNYWLLGKENDTNILKYYEKGETTEIKIFSESNEFFFNQLYKYNDLIVVIASKINKRMLGGFGGTKPVMYLSKDNGLTWSNYQLNKVPYLKPISFYKDIQMNAYIGNRKLLSYNFKD